MRGGMEAIYDDIASGDDIGPSGSIAPKLGFMAFVPVVPARLCPRDNSDSHRPQVPPSEIRRLE